jgi:hypothetical protein
MSDEREEEDVEEEQEKAQHYAITIGHVLENDTTQATLAHPAREVRVFKAAWCMRRLNRKVARSLSQPRQLHEKPASQRRT